MTHAASGFLHAEAAFAGRLGRAQLDTEGVLRHGTEVGKDGA
jgi:hypothetical protein